MHPRDNIERLYVSRKEGERGLASIEDCINGNIQVTSIETLDKLTQKSKEILITSISNNNSNIEVNRKTTKTRKLNNCMHIISEEIVR